MQYYFRFECYNGPDRQFTTQLCPDIPVDSTVNFVYAQPIQVGSYADDKWPLYYVANFTHAEEIDDPAIPGKNALLVHVYVARGEQ